MLYGVGSVRRLSEYPLLRWVTSGAIGAGLVAVVYGLSDAPLAALWLELEEPGVFLASLLLLLGAFGLRLVVWKIVLDGVNGRTPWTMAVESRYRPILAKYAPGKVWGVLSVAGCLERHGVQRGRALAVTGWFQLQQIVSGLTVGVIGAGVLGAGALDGGLPLGVLWAGAAGLCVVVVMAERIVHCLGRRSGRVDPEIRVGISRAAIAVGLSAVAWLIMGMAYWQFAWAYGLGMSIEFIALLPLANVIGMLSVVTPGGIGVRESAITALMIGCGAPSAAAAPAAIWSRVWFMIAELIIFAVGLHAGSRTAPGRAATGR